jgi:quinol monooxygenase YgiN
MMKTVMVRYKLKPESVADNEALVRQVFVQLARDKPAGMRYQVFKQADGVSFVHLSAFDNPAGNPLTQLESFKAFTAAIKERCVELPVTMELQQVGRYDHLA